VAYTITLSDGSILTTIEDGTVDTTTSLTLIGRNYSGYGQYIADDLVYLLENFAKSSSPVNPIVGQLWWNTDTQTMQVYDGTSWSGIGSTITGSNGLTIMNSNCPTGQRRWRIAVSNESPYIGMLVFQLMSDDGNTVINTVLALDGINNLVLGRVTYS
jgi:hypothetical protein